MEAVGAVERLTPHMKAYSEAFSDSGAVNWLPYTMYFHPFSYRSDVVNTDASGFRYSMTRSGSVSPVDLGGIERCSIIAGSSTVFGIGASADQHTLASRMSEHDSRAMPWLNFGGRSFNSTQEMILFSLNRHRLPDVEEVVLFSGFNDLGLARLPQRMRLDHGAFFMCGQFHDTFVDPQAPNRWFGIGKPRSDGRRDDIPTLDDQLSFAANLVLRNLANWRALCADIGAKLTFVLQPLAGWVRETGSSQEEALFLEREKVGGFAEQYGDILKRETYIAYRDRLSAGAEALGVTFIDITPHIRDLINHESWLFVDRIHFTDLGHDLVAKLLLDLAIPRSVSS